MQLIKAIVPFFCLLFINAVYSQTDSDSCHFEFDTLTKRNIYFITDIEPSFPGGIEEMKNFINKNIEYVDPGCYQATIYVSFTVETDGKLTNIQIKRGVENDLNNAAVDVIKKMPDWVPAKCHGLIVPSMAIIPIRFE